jgi:hypothetical protein
MAVRHTVSPPATRCRRLPSEQETRVVDDGRRPPRTPRHWQSPAPCHLHPPRTAYISSTPWLSATVLIANDWDGNLPIPLSSPTADALFSPGLVIWVRCGDNRLDQLDVPDGCGWVSPVRLGALGRPDEVSYRFPRAVPGHQRNPLTARRESLSAAPSLAQHHQAAVGEFTPAA